MASYETELEALNALCDLVTTTNTNLGTVKTDIATIKGQTDGIESALATSNTRLTDIRSFSQDLITLVGEVDNDLETIDESIGTTNTKLDTANTNLGTINTSIGTTNSTLAQTNLKLDSSNNLQTAANAIMTEIQGEVVDVRNIPTDTCIIRVYVGDITKKREGAAREVARLLGEGYRPYMIMGISEDLARVLFVKYPDPNESKVPNAD